MAFNSDRDGDGTIYWQKADGSDSAVLLIPPEKGTNRVPKSWSSDGKQLLFEAVTGSKFSLWTVSLQDKKSTQINGVQSSVPLDPTFSPNGRWIAYQSDETGANQVYVKPFPAGTSYLITKSGGSRPVWSPDGTQLFYFPPAAGQFAVVTLATRPSFTISNPQPLERGWLETFARGPRVYDILRDGKRFIAVVPAGEASSGAGVVPHINVVLNWFEEFEGESAGGEVMGCSDSRCAATYSRQASYS